MSLSYICNPEEAVQLHAEDTKTNGVYYFIRRKDEKSYFAYRKVEMGAGKFYYIQVSLPPFQFNKLIVSGRVPQIMGTAA